MAYNTDDIWDPGSMSNDLPLADRAKLFNIIDECFNARGSFGERLLEALARHLNYRDASFVSGKSWIQELRKQNYLAHHRAASMMPEYIDRYCETGIFRSRNVIERVRQAGVVSLNQLPPRLVERHRPFNGFLKRYGVKNVLVLRLDTETSGQAWITLNDYSGETTERDLLRLCLLRNVLSVELEREKRKLDFAEAASLLAPHERAVAELVARGLNNEQIALRLGLQVDSVKKYLTGVYQKVGVRSRTQLALRLR
jgi:DNA-binding CsgD family transcriptional regulator